MPNFVKILRQIKKFPIQAIDSEGLVCRATICYSGPISVVPKKEQLLGERRMGVKFQYSSRVYRRTDGHG